MTIKLPRPIVPAPLRDPGYPRSTTVWRAFAAGVLTVAAFPSTSGADCALPEHGNDKTAQPVGKKTAAQVKSEVEGPQLPMPGRMGAVIPVPQPDKRVPLGGVFAPPRMIEGKQRAPEPAHPHDKKVIETDPPKSPKRKPPKPDLDGEQASVTAAMIHIHPHGPDDPCHVPDASLGRLVIRFG